MKLEEYIEIAKTLTHSGISERVASQIIEELGKDRRTEIMEEGKTKRTETMEKKEKTDNKPTPKQINLLKRWKIDGTKLTRKEASKLIDEKLKKIKEY